MIEVTLWFSVALERRYMNIEQCETASQFKEKVLFEYDEPKYKHWEVVSTPDSMSSFMEGKDPESWAWDYIALVGESILPAEAVDAGYNLGIPADKIHELYVGTSVKVYEDHYFKGE